MFTINLLILVLFIFHTFLFVSNTKFSKIFCVFYSFVTYAFQRGNKNRGHVTCYYSRQSMQRRTQGISCPSEQEQRTTRRGRFQRSAAGARECARTPHGHGPWHTKAPPSTEWDPVSLRFPSPDCAYRNHPSVSRMGSARMAMLEG